MVHESLQDRDFLLFRVEDPLFVALDRSVVYYDGSHSESRLLLVLLVVVLDAVPVVVVCR